MILSMKLKYPSLDQFVKNNFETGDVNLDETSQYDYVIH